MKLTKPQKLVYDMEQFAGGTIAVICGSMLVAGEKPAPELAEAIHTLYRLNDALRMRITEAEDGVALTVTDYREQDIEVLCFEDKAQLDAYASNYAKTPLELHGSLCEFKIIELPGQFGALVKLHHLIGDAWTLSLIGSQFHAILNGDTPEAYSYTEYEASETAYQASKRYAKDRAFFLEQFKKCDEVTYLNDAQVHSFSAERETFIIEAEQARRINDYLARHDTSVFMLFMTALAAYVSRVKMNAEKFYIGTAVINRAGAREKNTAGMFINTVPMLLELDNDRSFVENLSTVEEMAFSVFRHQKYNYGDVLADIRKEYSFTEKLYDVMLSYQNAAIGGEVESTWYHSGMQTESLQIHIDDRDGKGIFRIHYDYQTEKFTAQEIERMHRHILTLLFDAIKDDSKKLYELEILSASEKQKLLYDFNDTAMEYPRDKCIHQLFEEQVTKTPDKTALQFGDRKFSCAELNGLANCLAWLLKEKGVKHGDIVAIISKRSYHIVVAMLAILKADAIYLPIDPNYPEERINTILEDANCKIVLTYDVSYRSNNVVQISEEISGSANNPISKSVPEDACCIIYTSGSTGRPKGALLQHKGLVNFTYASKSLYSSGNCVLGFSIYTFDAFIADTISPMLRGMTAVMATEEQQFNQLAFENLVKQVPDCDLFITPTKFTQFTTVRMSIFIKRFKIYVLAGRYSQTNLYICFPQIPIFTMCMDQPNALYGYSNPKCVVMLLHLVLP